MPFGRKVITLTITITTWLADCQPAPDFHGKGSDGRVKDDLDIHRHIESITYLYLLFFFKVNFFIFLKILKLLISKLRAHQMCFRDYKYRWVAWGQYRTVKVYFDPFWLFWLMSQEGGKWHLYVSLLRWGCLREHLGKKASGCHVRLLLKSEDLLVPWKWSQWWVIKSTHIPRRKLKNAPKNGWFIGIGRNHMKGSWTVALFEVTE